VEILIAEFGAAVTLAVIVVAMVAAYLGYSVIQGVRVYFRLRGIRLVTCPETFRTELVEVNARSIGLRAILDKPCLRLSKCSRWPMRDGCGQECLSQIEAHPSVLRISAAWRST
jgi:hypothetical protein